MQTFRTRGERASRYPDQPDGPFAFTGTIDTAYRAGQIEVNGGAFNPAAPFGGYKQSGHGRELGRFGLEEFLAVKSLQL